MVTKAPAKKAVKAAPKAAKKPATKATPKPATKPVAKPAAKAAPKVTPKVETKPVVEKQATAKLPAKKEMKLGKVAKGKKPELDLVKRVIEDVKPFEKKEVRRAPVKPPVTAVFSNKVLHKESTQEAILSMRDRMAQAAVRSINAPIVEEEREEAPVLAQAATVMHKADVRRPAVTKKREVAEGRISFEDAMQAANNQPSSKPLFDVTNYLRK